MEALVFFVMYAGQGTATCNEEQLGALPAPSTLDYTVPIMNATSEVI